MIQFCDLELVLGLLVEINKATYKSFELVLLQLHFSLEVCQLVRVVRIERNVFKQVFSLEILLLMILGRLQVVFLDLLLLFLIRLLHLCLV
jgi:hypothetical protein